MECNLAFGMWGESKQWGWRVEWHEGDALVTKDLFQRDLRPGEARADAESFVKSLNAA